MTNLARHLKLVLVLANCCAAVSMEAGTELLGDTDKFYLIVTSDPQYPYLDDSDDPRLEGYDNSDRKLSEALIRSQYRSIQYVKEVLSIEDPGTPLRGVVINGDLTNWGHGWQLDKMKELWKEGLGDTHVFMGLGNHDYQNNVDDCSGNNCANRMYDFMVEHRNNHGWLTTDFSSVHAGAGYLTGLNWHQTQDDDRIGPLWYSFRLGGRASTGDDTRVSRVPGVRFIQLQNHARYTKKWNEGRDNEINIRPDWIWLENQLAWARYYGEPIVFLGHCGVYTADVARMARQYGVAAAFSGHLHWQLGQQEGAWWWSSRTPLFKSGSAFRGGGVWSSPLQAEADGSYLLVKFDLAADEMTVWRMGNFLQGAGWATERVLEGTYPLYPVLYKEDDDLVVPWMAGQAWSHFPKANPLASGFTLVENGSNKHVRVKQWCIGCDAGDWIVLRQNESHTFNVRAESGWVVHGYTIQYHDSSADIWKDLDDGRPPIFQHIVKERCVNVTNFEDETLGFDSSNQPTTITWRGIGWNVECDYGSEPPPAPPAFDDGDAVSFSIEENNAPNASVGTVVATDPNGDPLTYSLLDHWFSIDPASGEIKVKNGKTLDYETKSSHSVQAGVSDGKDSAGNPESIPLEDDTIEVTISVKDGNEPPAAPETPTVLGVSRTSVRVSLRAQTEPTKPTVTGFDVQYRASGEQSWADYVSFGVRDRCYWTVLGCEIKGLAAGTTYEVQVRATNADGTGHWSATGVGSTHAPNRPPVFTRQPTSLSVEENSVGGTSVGTVAATDPDGASLAYSLDAEADAVFDIDAAGNITVQTGTAPNHEAKAQYLATVTASDGEDSTDHDVTISVTDVEEPPGAPGTPTVAGASRTSVAVAWTAPDATGKPPVTDYDVQYRATGEAVWETHAEFAGTDTDTTIEGLNESTSYEVQVRATNAEGGGPWSPKGSGTTFDNNPPLFTDQPTFLSVAENSVGGTLVGKLEATDADGDILSYQVVDPELNRDTWVVFYLAQTSPDPGRRVAEIRVQNSAILNYEDEDLRRFSATVTANDHSDLTDHHLTIRVTDVDEPPRALGTPNVAGASRTSMTVTWTAPDAAGKPPVTDYDVQYRVLGELGWDDASFDGTDTTATIKGLYPGTAYEVQVQATNDEGTGDWSPSGSGSTHPNGPPVFEDQPTTLSVAENSAGETSVGTVAATDADGDTLEYSLDDASAAVLDIDADGSITVQWNAVLDHEAKAEYLATVRADDGFDRTEHGVTIRVSDVNEPPVAPGTPTVTGASTASVTVSWTAPDATGQPPVTDYNVGYRESGEAGWTDAFFDGTDTTATITGLTEGTAYEAQVQASNDEGAGAWSETGSGATKRALTTEFVGVPAEHNGRLFRFELRFSEEFQHRAGIPARLRDKAFRVENGTVREAKRAEPGKNRRWTIGVRPDSHEDVTVELPATTDCDAADAICTAAGRPLSNSLSATVAGPPPLTAEFVDLPAGHDGRLFRFELLFSEEFQPKTGLPARLRDKAFRVENGTVREAKRAEPGKNRRWTIGVRPDSHEDVTVELPATTDCDAADAICTAAGRPLSNSLSATVAGPPPLTAEFVDVPADHDGRLFRFELRFGEEFQGTAGLLARLRDQALQATNGAVEQAKRVEPGKNRRWTIGVQPDSHEDVSVELSATTDCDAPDAICTKSGRPISNSLSATVEGPSRSNAMAATLDLLQGPLSARLSRNGDPVQPLALVAFRPTMAVAGVHTVTSARPKVVLRVATGSGVHDIDADLHATTKVAAEDTANDADEAFRVAYLAQVPATLVRTDATFSVLVDPDNLQAESDETDNELALPLSDLRVVQPPTFKVTLVPIVHRSAVRTFAADDVPEPMLAETLALLPIGAYSVSRATALVVDSGTSPRQMLDRLHATWNREADSDEFYHGLYGAEQVWPKGLALVGGPVAVSSFPEDGVPDESGWLVANGIAHNFGLRGDTMPDSEATYGWSSASERFFSLFDREIMAATSGDAHFISHAHYEQALTWMSRSGVVATSVGGSEPTTAVGGVALTGGVDASGTWYLHSAERSLKPPRQAPAGEYSAIVYDETGIPLLTQTLRIVPLSTGPGGVWALRVPDTFVAARTLRIWGRGGDLLLDADFVLEQTSPLE